MNMWADLSFSDSIRRLTKRQISLVGFCFGRSVEVDAHRLNIRTSRHRHHHVWLLRVLDCLVAHQFSLGRNRWCLIRSCRAWFEARLGLCLRVIGRLGQLGLAHTGLRHSNSLLHHFYWNWLGWLFLLLLLVSAFVWGVACWTWSFGESIIFFACIIIQTPQIVSYWIFINRFKIGTWINILRRSNRYLTAIQTKLIRYFEHWNGIQKLIRTHVCNICRPFFVFVIKVFG